LSVACFARRNYWRRKRNLPAGELHAAAFKKVEDRAVDQAVAVQEEAGLEIITDGKMRRQSFQAQMTATVDGFGEHTLDRFYGASGTEIRQRETRASLDQRGWAW
jgi:methionine synthase II (cobalamin-independent)